MRHNPHPGDIRVSTGDGKNRKFRILCKRCNSYLHAKMLPLSREENEIGGLEVGAVIILCTKCGNAAETFDEEL
jgi:hypothetical protein